MNEPAIPIALVARHPPGCLPGTINLASAPTISPMMKAPSRWNSITHRLFANPRLVNHSRRYAAGLSVERRRSTVHRLAFGVRRSAPEALSSVGSRFIATSGRLPPSQDRTETQRYGRFDHQTQNIKPARSTVDGGLQVRPRRHPHHRLSMNAPPKSSSHEKTH